MLRSERIPSSRHRGSIKRPGFTLIEIMVAVVLVAIVLGLSMGHIDAIMTRDRVRRAAYAVSNELQSAFALAARDREPVLISFESSTMEIRLSDVKTGTVLRRTSFEGFNIRPSDVTLSRDSLTVYPEGLAGDSISITLSAMIGETRYSHRVRMTRGGLVQVK